MGKDCGKKSVVNFDLVWKAVKDRTDYHTSLRRLDGWDEEFKARIAPLERNFRARQDLHDTIKARLPEMYRGLCDRAKQGAKGSEVVLGAKRRQGLPSELTRGKEQIQVRRIQGLGLFKKTRPSFRTLQLSLADFRKSYEERPPVDGPSASALIKLVRKAERRAEKAEDWVRATAQLLSVANLELALKDALHLENVSVELESGKIRVGYMPGRSVVLYLPDVTFQQP